MIAGAELKTLRSLLNNKKFNELKRKLTDRFRSLSRCFINDDKR